MKNRVASEIGGPQLWHRIHKCLPGPHPQWSHPQLGDSGQLLKKHLQISHRYLQRKSINCANGRKKKAYLEREY